MCEQEVWIAIGGAIFLGGIGIMIVVDTFAGLYVAWYKVFREKSS